jgi:hypothetical protein
MDWEIAWTSSASRVGTGSAIPRRSAIIVRKVTTSVRSVGTSRARISVTAASTRVAKARNISRRCATFSSISVESEGSKRHVSVGS